MTVIKRSFLLSILLKKENVTTLRLRYVKVVMSYFCNSYKEKIIIFFYSNFKQELVLAIRVILLCLHSYLIFTKIILN